MSDGVRGVASLATEIAFIDGHLPVVLSLYQKAMRTSVIKSSARASESLWEIFTSMRDTAWIWSIGGSDVIDEWGNLQK
jgi:hypothetical protein